MAAPLVSEDTDLDRLLATVAALPGARILYQDKVRRGGFFGFFAREVHRVAYQVADGSPAPAAAPPPVATVQPVAPVQPVAVASPAPTGADAGRVDLQSLFDELIRHADASDVGRPAGEVETGPAKILPGSVAPDDVAPDDVAPDDVAPDEMAEDAPPAAPRSAADFASVLRACAEQARLREGLLDDEPAPATVAAAVPRPLRPGVFEAAPATVATPELASAAVDDLIAAVEADDAIEPTAQPVSAAQLESPAQPVSAAQAESLAGPESPAGPFPVPHREPADTPPKLRAARGGVARARLEMLIELRRVGVPVGLNPRSDAQNVYSALDEIVEELPEPPPTPSAPGELLALVGELTPTLRVAQAAAEMLRIRLGDVRIAGLANHPVELLVGVEPDPDGERASIDSPQAALRSRRAYAASDTVSLVVVATDAVEQPADEAWLREMIDALDPTAVWAVLDATRKTEDNQAELDRLGRVDALAVHGARRSASPASVWDLELPVALLDGRPATPAAWAALLFGLLRPDRRRVPLRRASGGD